MKKQFIDFTKVRYRTVRLAPKIESRRTRFSSHEASSSYRSDGGDDDEEDEEKEKLVKKINSLVKKQLDSRATKADVENIQKQIEFLSKGVNEKGEKIESPFPIEALRSMADEKTGVVAKLTEQALKIKTLEEEAKRKVKEMNVRSQVAAWQEENKSVLEAIAGGKKAEGLSSLEIRAVASPMTVATVNSGTSPYIGGVEVEPGYNSILRFPTTFWDSLTKGTTGAPTYVWANKTNPQGAAGFIGPGVAKPGVSFSIVAETSTAKKIAASAKAGTELLQDIEGMTTFIEQELYEQLMQEVNSKLMNNAGSTTEPTGVQQLSGTYNLTTVKTTNPNYMDCLRAVVAQLRSGKLSGDITIYINSVDAANMDLSKATDSGVYMLPPFVTSDGRTISGARVIEDSNIAVGYFQAGFMKYYRILVYKGYTVSWGWENDDFTKNLITAVGEMRLHQFFNTRHTGAFVYDTFENVKEAIREA